MNYPNLTFEKPDLETFTNLRLAYQVMEIGGNAPCVLNAANEVAVAAFLKDEIKFLQIAEVNKKTIEGVDFINHPTLDELYETDRQARIFAEKIIQNL